MYFRKRWRINLFTQLACGGAKSGSGSQVSLFESREPAEGSVSVPLYGKGDRNGHLAGELVVVALGLNKRPDLDDVLCHYCLRTLGSFC